MNRRSVHISIPTPCHESWDGMDATARGAFCHSCQKEVIDFSAMTDREVIEYLSKTSRGCGKFRADQINTNITHREIENGVFKWRALFLSAISLLASKEVFARTIAKENTIKTDQNDQATKTTTDGNPTRMEICGKVVDVHGEPIAGASIQVLAANDAFAGNGAVSDSTGEFHIELSAEETKNIVPHLRISHGTLAIEKYLDWVAYQSHTFILKKSDPVYYVGVFKSSGGYYTVSTSQKKLTPELKEQYKLLGDVAQINGSVIDATGQPLANASIMILDSSGVFHGEGTTSDCDGRYTIRLAQNDIGMSHSSLTISYRDYKPVHIDLVKAPLQDLSVSLYRNAGFIGSDSIVSYLDHIPITRHNRFRSWIRHLFKKRLKHD